MLTGWVLFGVYTAAQALDDPSDDVPAAVRDAIEDGFEDTSNGTLSFDNVADGQWTRMYVFKPLSKLSTIERALHDREGIGDLPTAGPSGSQALLVFADDERVLGSARVDRHVVDMSCAVDNRNWHPWVGILTRSRPLRVIRTERRRPPLLAATANDRRSVLRCIRQLPHLQAD